jgi:hypothetical protein
MRKELEERLAVVARVFELEARVVELEAELAQTPATRAAGHVVSLGMEVDALRAELDMLHSGDQEMADQMAAADAALAVQQERADELIVAAAETLTHWGRVNDGLSKALAAEREKVERVLDALPYCLDVVCPDDCDQCAIRAALAPTGAGEGET